MATPVPWESLDERAERAVAESRFLLKERRALLDDLTIQYSRRLEVARKAVVGIRRTEAELVTKYRLWLSQIGAT